MILEGYVNSSFILESQSVCSICSHFVAFAYNLYLRIHLWETLLLVFTVVSRSELGVRDANEEGDVMAITELSELVH